MTCPECGLDLEEGARFCGACGTRVTPGSDLYSVSDSAPTRNLDVEEGDEDPGATTPASVSPPAPKAASNISALRAANPALDATMLAAPAPAASGPFKDRSGPAPSPATAVKNASSPASAPHSSAPSSSAPPSAVATLSSSPSSDTKVPSAPPAAAASGFGRSERKSENSGSRDDMVGRMLNKRYVVGEKVGEGGFGAVFRGKQLATGREVALKILHPYNLTDKTIVARFRREAEACSRLRNPHTVITYDFDETEDGVLYLAMEMLHGKSLHHLERAEGPLNPDRVLDIIDQVAEALGEAHQNGIVHRDMKPENVFIENRGDADYVKVLDFGIAKVMADERGQIALTAVARPG